MNSVELCKLGSLIYPIMLAQEHGAMSEAKAAELIGLDIESYRLHKHQAIQAIVSMMAALPSPLTLLLGDTQDRQG